MKQDNIFAKSGVRQLRLCRDAHELMREQLQLKLREGALKMALELMNEEILELCGPKFSRKQDEQCVRAGSDPGCIILQGQRVQIRKPRVKDEQQREAELKSYAALRDFDLLSDKITRYMIAGVSTRDYQQLLDEVAGGTGLSKSSVSKAFQQGSKRALDELNGRDLSTQRFVALMIDSIHIAERSVVTVLGITATGKKSIVGLREGSSETSEVVRDLFHNLVDRGFKVDEPMLFVIDGAKALKKAIRKLFGDRCHIQRCIRHKERNILQYLPETHHVEFRRRWKKLHGIGKIAEALKEYESLDRYLGEINHQARTSLEEAEQDTLTLIKLGAPEKLRKTLASTNPIESAFDGVRCRTARVKNWHVGSDQICRWTAAALLESESRFKAIRGFREIPLLINAMKNSILQTNLLVA